MTASVGAVRGQLWPVPDQMKQYLDNWVTYTQELEKNVQLLKAASKTREEALSERIGTLHADLAAMERPLRERIGVLEAERLTLRVENESLRNELEAAIRLLATALEVAGNPRLSLLSLINDAVLLVEEAKKQVRETL